MKVTTAPAAINPFDELLACFDVSNRSITSTDTADTTSTLGRIGLERRPFGVSDVLTKSDL